MKYYDSSEEAEEVKKRYPHKELEVYWNDLKQKYYLHYKKYEKI